MATPKKDDPTNSTMASRKADRERREAAGEIEPRKPYEPRGTLRAGIDGLSNPVVVVTHVRG